MKTSQIIFHIELNLKKSISYIINLIINMNIRPKMKLKKINIILLIKELLSYAKIFVDLNSVNA